MRKRGQLGKDSVKKENTVEVCGQLKEAGENLARGSEWKRKFECDMCQTELTGS